MTNQGNIAELVLDQPNKYSICLYRCSSTDYEADHDACLPVDDRAMLRQPEDPRLGVSRLRLRRYGSHLHETEP